MTSKIETILVRIFVISIVIPLALLGLGILKITRKEDWFVKKFIIPYTR